MKFGRKLQREADQRYRHYYLAYKDLKKAIKLITGTATSSYTIKEVTSNFGNIQAFSGSIYRPPEARFQDLLNHELEKINSFSTVTFAAVAGGLRQVLKEFRDLDGRIDEKIAEELSAEIDRQGADLVFLERYQRLNCTGFRKITKKCDKHNQSASSAWYMAKIAKEPFMKLDFAHLLRLLSICYHKLRKISKQLTPADETRAAASRDEEVVSEWATSPGAAENDDGRRDSASICSPPFEGTAAASSATGEAERDGEQRRVKYLVQLDDIMRVKVLIAKHLSLAAVGSQRSDESRILAALRDPIASLQPSWSFSSSSFGGGAGGSSSGAARSADRLTSTLSSNGNPASLAGQDRCCLYLDTSNFDVYSRLLKLPQSQTSSTGVTNAQHSSATSAEAPEDMRLLRCTWNGPNDGNPELLIRVESLEGASESALEVCEWPDASENDLHEYEKLVATTGHRYEHAVLKQKHIADLLKGTLDIEVISQKLTGKAEAGKNPQRVAQFLKSLMEQIQAEKLIPSIQSWYRRTSFRSRSSGNANVDVAVNIDESIRYVSEREDDEDDPTADGSEGWKTPTAAASLVSEKLRIFPFAILDVSLGPDAQLDLEEVIGLPSVTEVWGFQSFVHGTALLHPKQILDFPSWYSFTRQRALEQEQGGCRGDDDNEDERAPSERNGLEKERQLASPDRPSSDPTESPDTLAEASSGNQLTRRPALRVDVLRPDQPSSRLRDDHFVASLHRDVGGRRDDFQELFDPHQSRPHRVTEENIKTSPLPPPPTFAAEKGEASMMSRGSRYRIGGNSLGEPLLPGSSVALPVLPGISLANTVAGGGRGPSHERGAMFSPSRGGALPNEWHHTNGTVSGREDESRWIRGRQPSFSGSASSPMDPRRVAVSSVGGGVYSGLGMVWRKCGELAVGATAWLRAPLGGLWSGEDRRRVAPAAEVVRVEPKTFFANERTLLQWMNTAVLLSTIAITLINFGTSSGRISGLILSPVALFFIIYPFMIFLKRSQSLERKEPINYNDRLGPSVLVICLVLALSTIILLNIIDGPSAQQQQRMPAAVDYDHQNFPQGSRHQTKAKGPDDDASPSLPLAEGDDEQPSLMTTPPPAEYRRPLSGAGEGIKQMFGGPAGSELLSTTPAAAVESIRPSAVEQLLTMTSSSLAPRQQSKKVDDERNDPFSPPNIKQAAAAAVAGQQERRLFKE